MLSARVRRSRPLLALAVVSAPLVRASGQAPAPTEPRRLLVGIFGGSSAPTGRLRDYSRTGAHFGALAQWRPTPRWLALQAELAHHRLGATYYVVYPLSGGSPTSNMGSPLRVTSGGLIAMGYVPMGTARVRPYVRAGVSADHLGGRGTFLKGGDLVTREWYPATHVGAGVDLALRRLTLFVESRYTSVSSTRVSTRMLPISAGVRFAP